VLTRAFGIAILGAALMAACSVTPPLPPVPTLTAAPTAAPITTPEPAAPPDEELADTSWQLAAYADSQGQMVDVLADTRITLAFSADRFGGSAGCNRYKGAYTLDGWNIAPQINATTERACTEPVMQQEDAYLSALSRAVKTMRTEGSLDMLDAAGQVVLSFTQIEPLPLAGPTWQVTTYHNGTGALVAPLAATAIELTFGGEGQLAGAAGCNTYRASFEAEAPAITIAPPVATRKSCAEPAGVMAQETAYLASLNTTATYAIVGDELTLRDRSGATVLTALAPLAAHDPATPVSSAAAAAQLEGTTGSLRPMRTRRGRGSCRCPARR
jgi:heat shock protein HslJ